MPFLKKHRGVIVAAQALFDTACIGLAGVISATVMQMRTSGLWRDHLAGHKAMIAVFIVAWWFAAADQRLFASRRGDRILSQIGSVVKSATIALFFSLFFVAFFTKQPFNDPFFLWFALFSVIFLASFRTMVRLALMQVRRRGFNCRWVLLVGANERSKHLLDVMKNHVEHGYILVGVLDDDPGRMNLIAPHEAPYLGNLDNLANVMTSQVVDEVYIVLPVRTYYEQITNMAYLCEGAGTPVRLVADMFPPRFAMRSIHQLGDVPLLSVSAVPEAMFQLALKRVLDFAVSGLFLALVAWWLFPAIAILIKLDSPGPVFFKQQRVGLNQRRFNMLKFRSMVRNAEALKKELAEKNEADGPIFKMRRDPRMTRVGRWLRKLSIDELPQFINVFVGHMSLVGPRPPLPREVEQYSWAQRRRLSVRPGITGLQQVSGRSDLSFEEWIELDLSYIDNWTLMDDLRIMVRTFEVVVLGRGAA